MDAWIDVITTGGSSRCCSGGGGGVVGVPVEEKRTQGKEEKISGMDGQALLVTYQNILVYLP